MMRDCEDGAMRDLLPGYVQRTLSESDRRLVVEHVSSCAECAAEVELIAAASRALPAPQVDIGKIVKALPPAPRTGSRTFFATRIGQLAAAVGIVAIGAFSVIAVRGMLGTPPVQQAKVQAPDAGSAVVAAKPRPASTDSFVTSTSPAGTKAGDTGISFGGGLSDLTDDQLDALLGELDSLDSLPSAEPETHLSPIVPEADGGHNAW